MFLMSLLDTAIGWLAPVDCLSCGQEGAVLCEICAAEEILPHGERCYLCGRQSPACRTCQHCRPGSPRYVWLTTDYENLAKDLLKKYKYDHQRAAAISISKMMAETFRRGSVYDWRRKDYLVVAVPTATSRARQRGFDHAELLARKVAAELGLKFHPLLGRRGQGRQVGAKRAQRLRQQDGKYYLKNKTMPAGRNILLIDDVVTTGSTLRAVTKQLRAAGAGEVSALVFAKRL